MSENHIQIQNKIEQVIKKEKNVISSSQFVPSNAPSKKVEKVLKNINVSNAKFKLSTPSVTNVKPE